LAWFDVAASLTGVVVPDTDESSEEAEVAMLVAIRRGTDEGMVVEEGTMAEGKVEEWRVEEDLTTVDWCVVEEMGVELGVEARATPKVVYPPMGPLKVGEAVT
jgi:hypothetical protein